MEIWKMVLIIFYIGVNDIKKHRWFNNFSWEDLLKKKTKAAYVPNVKSLGDVSNFEEYPDSGTSSAIEIKPNIDPFLSWWFTIFLTFNHKINIVLFSLSYFQINCYNWFDYLMGGKGKKGKNEKPIVVEKVAEESGNAKKGEGKE